MIKITLPDHSIREFDKPVSGMEIARAISDRLARVLGVGVGDQVRLKPLMGRIEGEKTAIVRVY